MKSNQRHQTFKTVCFLSLKISYVLLIALQPPRPRPLHVIATPILQQTVILTTESLRGNPSVILTYNNPFKSNNDLPPLFSVVRDT